MSERRKRVAKPTGRKIDIAALVAEIHRRYPNTMRYLAKKEREGE